MWKIVASLQYSIKRQMQTSTEICCALRLPSCVVASLRRRPERKPEPIRQVVIDAPCRHDSRIKSDVRHDSLGQLSVRSFGARLDDETGEIRDLREDAQN